MRHLRAVLISWGPLGVLLMATIESMGIPNPGGTDLLLLLVSIAYPKQANLAALLATTGSLVGTAVFYEITRRGGEKLLGKYTSSDRGQKFRNWFQRYGLITVFVPGLLPIPLPFKAFVACAGALSVPRIRFHLVLLAARLPRYFGLAYLGSQLGENSIVWAGQHVWQLLGAAVALFLILYALVKWADRNAPAAGTLQ